MAARIAMKSPLHETEHIVSRITREGKQLIYKLSVMQQPDRARACGASVKSYADRRPVDPPPVVELRIFESDPNNGAHKNDITFANNSNLFLYATLEYARPIAHGQVAGPPSCPVLTGVPIAGVAYLDRPSQAAYFIFPDLSVRHEGRYRLVFHLYEEIKDAKDADQDSNFPLPKCVGKTNGAPQAFLNFRLDVKSVPFTVYSAKKFPGLATSTSLSRINAEQGCRVRIRRDARMRRRRVKRGGEYDFHEERAAAAVYAGSFVRHSAPDRYVANLVERSRSNGNGSAMAFPYGFGDTQRRPPGPEYGFPGLQPIFQQPMPPASMSHDEIPSYQSYLSFGSTPTRYPAPCMPPNPPPVAASGMYSPHTTYANIRNPSMTSYYELTPAGYPMAQPMMEPSGGFSKDHLTSYRMEMSKALPYIDMNIADPMNPYSIPANLLPSVETPTFGSLPPAILNLKAPHTDFATLQNLAGIQPSIEPCTPSPGYDPVLGKRILYNEHASKELTHEDSFGLDEHSMQNGMWPDKGSYSVNGPATNC
ncbi:hypothetical protein N7478_010627 [Penicillium angulare]|uniref:uncharacterized protein n=1 Tax=Penicillium angulare TaxID=116970 RepID=UPI002540954E|nr:uncharacterized protein N7478_010627 [Penicillium angulare]KAJ5267819.1 hypothetical protein N7478_010627 [Penicillium angulare]